MTVTIDLTPEQREIVLQLLARHLPNTEAWAYGSRVKWTSRPQSDLDMVVFAKPQQARAVSDLREAFEESNLPFRVDLFVWDEVPEAFREQIEREYVVMVSDQDRMQTVCPPACDWPTATIEEVSEKVAMGPFGSSIKVETFVPEGVPIISGQHLHGIRVDDKPGFNFITQEHAKRLKNANVCRGDVIFTHAGNIGQVAYVPECSSFDRYVISQRQFYMRCDQSKVIPEFVALYFTSFEGRHKLLANASQVGVPSIAQPVTYLRTIKIPLPPLPEQRAIAHILGTLDDKIELNRRMNRTLEAMARALFKSWFIDFDPVRAKMALKKHDTQKNHSPLEGESAGQGRSPQSLRWGDAEAVGPGAPHPPTESAFASGSTSSTPPQGGSDWTAERARAYLDNMDEEIIALFPDRLVDSELGEIPEGWEVSTLGEISDKPQYGYTASAKTEPIGPQFLRITDINKEPWIIWSRVPYCKTTDKDLSKYRIKQGDVLIARMADPGHGILIEEDVEAVFASYLIRFRPNNSHHARILQYWLKSDTYWQMVKSRGSGTTRVSLNAQTLGGFPLVVPSNFVARAFTTVISGFRNRLVTNAKEMQVLISLRDTLLPKLISGEIRLSDSGKWVEFTR